MTATEDAAGGLPPALDPDDLVRVLEAGDADAVAAWIAALPENELPRVVSQLSDAQRQQLMAALPAPVAADVLSWLPDEQASVVVEQLPPADAAAILHELPSDEQADLIGDVERPEAAAILSQLAPEEADDVRALAGYAEDVAGGLMVKEFLAYRARTTVGEVIADMRAKTDAYADYNVQYTYVVDADQKLVGVLRLRDLLLRGGGVPLHAIMIRAPLAVQDQASLDELEDFFDEHAFLGAPVVDSDGALVGVVHRTAVEEALAERHDQDYLKSQGITFGEELRSMPLRVRAGRRLAWLSINIVLNLVAASVIATFQDTLQAVIALAVFLPIISDMSGCSGNQAVAVSMRELSLGLVRPQDAVRVWSREVTVGLINGSVLGLMIGVLAWVWKGNVVLGVVVGASLALNTVLAVSLGGLLPLLLRRFGRDPAIASGPILTTVTDACGFALALSMAALLAAHL